MMLPVRLGRIMLDYLDGQEPYYGVQTRGTGGAAGMGNNPAQG